MKKVVLTGATGFIGRHSIPFLLQRGYEVHAVFHNRKPILDTYDNLFWHHCDLLNVAEQKKIFSAVFPTHLLHFAWNVDHRTYMLSPDNLLWLTASIGLMKNFKEQGGERALFAGTCFEYDLTAKEALKENAALKPLSPYGASKVRLHEMIRDYALKEKLSYGWGRIFSLYGPYEQPTRLVPYVINSLLRDQTTHCLHGDLLRDFLYVEDVASAFAAFLDSPVCGAVNIASGISRSLQDIVMAIASQLNKNNSTMLKVDFLSSKEPRLILADVARLNKEVGWSPCVDLATGIAKTITWWKKQT